MMFAAPLGAAGNFHTFRNRFSTLLLFSNTTRRRKSDGRYPMEFGVLLHKATRDKMLPVNQTKSQSKFKPEDT